MIISHRCYSKVHRGLKGFVLDENNQPIVGATITIGNLAHVVRTAKDGDYWRLLTPGLYQVTASAEHHEDVTKEVRVAHGLEATVANFRLAKRASTPKTSVLFFGMKQAHLVVIAVLIGIIVTLILFAAVRLLQKRGRRKGFAKYQGRNAYRDEYEREVAVKSFNSKALLRNDYSDDSDEDELEEYVVQGRTSRKS